MNDVKLERVHFRLPAEGLALLEETAQSTYVTEASLSRKIIMEWYESPHAVDLFNGRPKLQATVQLPVSVANDIKELCEKRGVTRSALLRNIIMTSLTQEQEEGV